MIKKYKILTQVFFMIGLPEEIPEDINATEKLITCLQPDPLFLLTFVPYPGTAIYDNMVREGFINDRAWDKFVFFGEEVSWCTRHFNSVDLMRMRKETCRRFYFRAAYVLKKISSLQSMADLHYYIKYGISALKSF